MHLSHLAYPEEPAAVEGRPGVVTYNSQRIEA
jgi:hypothetical protein